MASKVINISLPEELLREVDRLARAEKRTRSELFREAVRRYLEVKQSLWRGTERREWATLADPALARIWDNEKDALYDSWEPQRSQAEHK